MFCDINRPLTPDPRPPTPLFSLTPIDAMLLSMTGFGEARLQDERWSVGVEVRTVNNRHLKLTLRASEPYNLLESEFEKVIRRFVRYLVGEPYQVAGAWFRPGEQPNYDKVGIASWYGKEFHGRHTASGEINDMYQPTAAHRTADLGTYALVTSL